MWADQNTVKRLSGSTKILGLLWSSANMAPTTVDRMAHIGIHPQKQAGLNWVGIALPLGKLTCDQMHGLAKIGNDLGDGDIRLTVWQNLLISGVRDTLGVGQ